MLQKSSQQKLVQLMAWILIQRTRLMYSTLVYLQTMKSYTPQYTRMVDWWKNETSENMAVHRLSVP